MCRRDTSSCPVTLIVLLHRISICLKLLRLPTADWCDLPATTAAGSRGFAWARCRSRSQVRLLDLVLASAATPAVVLSTVRGGYPGCARDVYGVGSGSSEHAKQGLGGWESEEQMSARDCARGQRKRDSGSALASCPTVFTFLAHPTGCAASMCLHCRFLVADSASKEDTTSCSASGMLRSRQPPLRRHAVDQFVLAQILRADDLIWHL